jgi:hypothetical protein
MVNRVRLEFSQNPLSFRQNYLWILLTETGSRLRENSGELVEYFTGFAELITNLIMILEVFDLKLLRVLWII